MARRTRDEWRDLFQAQSDSGLTATEFCRRHEVCLGSFFQRRRALDWQSGSPPGGGFVELKPAGAAGRAVELRYGEALLSLPAGVSPAWLASLLRGLSHAPV